MSRIKQLEGQLSSTSPTPVRPPAAPANPSIEASTSSIGGTWYIHRDDGAQSIVRGTTHKTRQFGQSHWVNVVSLFYDIMTSIEPLLREESCLVFPNIQKCKSFAKIIKARRKPVWPTPATSELPSKDLSDELVDCYLRTIESVCRVLHVPTFRRDYEALWVSNVTSDPTFMILIKLVLAIGAATYDEGFSMRKLAIQWVYEAQTWAAEPNIKQRLNLQGLQIHILLLTAREIVDVSGDGVYISSGDLFRRAVMMGLHIDPAKLPRKPPLVTEMRRRLWSTILEICLQSSLSSGGPPFLSLDDFDAQVPGNLDDDQLETDDPVPKTEGQFTQTSISIALRRTLPARLAVVKFLNNFHSSGTYEETLRLDVELRTAYKAISRNLQSLRSSSGPSFSLFGLQVIDFLMQRYLSALHIPFFGPGLDQTAYAFSRKIVVEASLRIWYIVQPDLSTMSKQSDGGSSHPVTHDLVRLTACGAGIFRLAVNHAALLIAVELKTQLMEDESLSPVPVRPDLLAVMHGAVDWSLHCIKIGETNMKGHLMSRMVMAQIDGLMRNVAKDELPRMLVQAALEAEAAVIPILEQMAIQAQAEGAESATGQGSFNTPSDADWDLMMTDALFHAGDNEAMGWMLNDEPMQSNSLCDVNLLFKESFHGGCADSENMSPEIAAPMMQV
ncbi:C6 transcription factor [Seiridium cupressi]